MQILLKEKVICYEFCREMKTFCNARGRFKEIRPTQQPIKSLILSLPYNKMC